MAIPGGQPDVGAGVVAYLRGIQAMHGADAIARYTTDHLRDHLDAEWSELVEVQAGQPVRVLASTDPVLTLELLATRQEAGDLPLPSASLHSHTTVVGDLMVDAPWPRFAELAAARTPLRSAVLPYVDIVGRGAAVLTVSDSKPHQFTLPRQQYAQVVAELAAMALSHQHQVAHLELGLEAGRRIGVAVGILTAPTPGRPRPAQDRLPAPEPHAEQHRRQNHPRRHRQPRPNSRTMTAPGPGRSPTRTKPTP